jgi:hypothetical protein
LPERSARRSAAHIRLRIVEPEFDGLGEILDGLGVLHRREVSVAAGGVYFGTVELQADGGVVIVDGALGLTGGGK